MMPRERKKQARQSMPTDRLSNLPETIMNTILMCMPLQTAVRTSILSKNWRYKWCRLPQLMLDDNLWNTTDNFLSPSIKFTNIMYDILTLHSGPVTKFTLSMSELKKYPKLGNLICFLSRNGIEHLVLKFSEWNRYKLPSSFFTCSQLRHLTLHNSVICPPPSFKGFDMLVSLELCDVTISPKLLESFISYSPLLEKLVLEISDTSDHIQSKAPNLRSFEFTGCLKCISFENVPLLAKLSLVYGESFEESDKGDLDNFFQLHPALEHLHLEYGSFQFLVAEVPRRLSCALNYLKRLYISMDDLDDLSCALCLIRSSPFLQDIEMEVSFGESGESDDPEGTDEVDEVSASFSDVTLNHVRNIKVKTITGTKLEMQLIKLLLAKSPMLVRMLIEPDLCYVNKKKGVKLLAESTKFQRASSKAEVICQLERKY